MPKKKKCRNAFYFFMLDWKKRAETRGQTFPNGLMDVQANPDCNAEWQSLNKQQKGPYEAMAKNDKITSQISIRDKQTTYGESIQVLQHNEEMQKKFTQDMCEYLKTLVDVAVNYGNLHQEEFCFIHVNWFFKMNISNRLEYFPAELAVGVFSLENGIKNVHHAIVSVPIPLGYKREALETSQNDHHIPVEYPDGETDFAIMYEKLINFLQPWKVGDKFPPLYTTRVLNEAVQSVLRKLCQTREEAYEFFVYDMESLFKSIAEQAYKKRSDRQLKYISAYAEYVFTRYKYLYKRGYECSFHKYVDGGSEKCSKSVLHQWAWRMCEEFCKPFDVDMIEGIHFPSDSEPVINDLVYSMATLNIKRNVSQATPNCSVLSMTGVSEQYRLRVSERTYEEEIRRRNESKPIHIIDYSTLNEPVDETVNESIHEAEKSVDKSTDGLNKKYVPNYMGEKQMRPPNITSCVAATLADYVPDKDEENFPPIGGRGVFSRHPVQKKKAPFGRGQGHA